MAERGDVEVAEAPTWRHRTVRRLRPLLRDRTAMLGMSVLVVFAAAALFAPGLAPHDPTAVDPVERFAESSAEHPLGTDHVGRDTLSRLLYGARRSLGAALAAAASVAVLGVAIGMAAGYLGGVVDNVIGRLIDMLLALPNLLFALVILGALGPGLRNLLIAVVVAWWAGYARIVRGVTLSEREKPYVEAAHAHGASRWRVAWRHMLPNIVGPIVVLTTLDMGQLLLAISALAFLGFTGDPAIAEWGGMLSEAQTYMRRAPQLLVYPGMAIFLAVLAFNLLGDGLRDVLDPRFRDR